MTQKKNNNKYDISSYRKQELSELAEFIVDEHFNDSAIDPIRLIQKYGLTYSCGHYKNAFDGLLEHKKGKFHIYLNIDRVKHEYEPRARFTLAHELGHYIIDEHRNALSSGLALWHPSFTDFSSDNEVELEADYFASSLLLPKKRFLNDILGKKFSFNLIDKLSKKYQTSLTATLLKFMSIGNHPIMIVCSINSRIKWFKYSDDFPFKYINAKSNFTVPEDTSAGQYFYETGTKNENSDEVVFAGDWFSVYRDEDYERKFYERCIYSDKNKFVMSIIWED